MVTRGEIERAKRLLLREDHPGRIRRGLRRGNARHRNGANRRRNIERDILRDTGYTEEEVNDAMLDMYDHCVKVGVLKPRVNRRRIRRVTGNPRPN